jgi:hypothetical protein
MDGGSGAGIDRDCYGSKKCAARLDSAFAATDRTPPWLIGPERDSP